MQWVRRPDGSTLNRCFQIFNRELSNVELLIGYEGNAFSGVAGPVDSLLEITAVHPLREEAVRRLLLRTDGDWGVVDRLLMEGELQRVEYEGYDYFLRRPNANQGV